MEVRTAGRTKGVRSLEPKQTVLLPTSLKRLKSSRESGFTYQFLRPKGFPLDRIVPSQFPAPCQADGTSPDDKHKSTSPTDPIWMSGIAICTKPASRVARSSVRFGRTDCMLHPAAAIAEVTNPALESARNCCTAMNLLEAIVLPNPNTV